MTEQLGFIRPLDDVIEEHMLKALQFHNWNLAAAARDLKVDRRTLYRTMKRKGWQRGMNVSIGP